MHDARHIANTFISIAAEMGDSLTHLKIQKLAYYAHAWTLAMHRKKLIRQPFEAWKYGPVAPSIYYTLSYFGRTPIPPDFQIRLLDKDETPLRTFDAEVLKAVYEKYGSVDPLELSAKTHAPGTPWAIARENGWTTIANSLIAEYHRKELIRDGVLKRRRLRLRRRRTDQPRRSQS